MGYFDALANASFQKGQHGQTLFFPYGKFGHGYEIPNDEKYHLIRRFVKRYIAASLALIILLITVDGFVYAFLALSVLFFYYAFRARHLTRDLGRSSERFSIAESCRSQARSHNLATLCVLEVCSLLFVLIGLTLLLSDIQSSIIAIVSIVFFGVCAVANGYMIYAKWKRY